jgi:hypothetical protein
MNIKRRKNRISTCGLSNLDTISTTIWFDINSKTPSEATTMNLSFGSIVLIRTSGSAYTPIVSATASPMDLVKAAPGNF